MTPYEHFYADFKRDPEALRARQKEIDAYAFSDIVQKLQRQQCNLSGYIMVDLFGEQLGNHLWEKFVIGHNRNLLSWLNNITTEYRFFMLNNLLTDKYQ